MNGAAGMGLAFGAILSLNDTFKAPDYDEDNAPIKETVWHDWKDPEFDRKCDDILNNFFARHPEIDREKKEFRTLYPEKVAAVRTLDNLSKTNSITPDEYVALFAEIFNF